jgi:hypothetical protein
MSDICEATEARCACTLAQGHEGPHVCVCGGSWERVDGRFRVHSWPSIPQPGSFAELCPEVYAETAALLPTPPLGDDDD